MDALLALGKKPFIKFSIIGGFATGMQFLLLIFFVEYFYLPIILSSCIAFAISIIISYLLNRRFTFNSSHSHGKTFIQYSLIYLLGCGINTSVMWIAIHLLTLYYVVAQIMASVIVLLWNYHGCRRWVFQSH